MCFRVSTSQGEYYTKQEIDAKLKAINEVNGHGPVVNIEPYGSGLLRITFANGHGFVWNSWDGIARYF